MQKQKPRKAASQLTFRDFGFRVYARWVDILPFVILHWLLYTRCAAAGTACILVDILVDRVDTSWKKLDFTHLCAAAERAKNPGLRSEPQVGIRSNPYEIT